MPTLILARHGTHDEIGKVLSGRSDIGLNALGKAQARTLAELIGPITIRTLHSSPRRRARETAEPLAERHELVIRVAKELDEIDFGRFTGHPFSVLDLDPEWQRWNAQRHIARCPNGETMGEAIARLNTYVSALSIDDFPAVFVTHCDIIRGFVAQQLGLGFDRLFAFECDPGSCTTLEMSKKDVRLVALNARPAL